MSLILTKSLPAVQEKSSRLLRIYQEVTQTVVRLGRSANDSDNVLDITEDIGSDSLNCGILSSTEEEKKASETLFGEIQTLSAVSYGFLKGKPGTFENMLFQRFSGPNRPRDGIICPSASLETLISRSWWQRI